MIEEQYISFETAKLAKEKGFDIPTNTYFSYFPKISEYGLVYVCAKLKDYNSEDINNGEYRISRPTQALLARWLREKHNMCVEVNFTSYGFVWCVCNTNNTEDNYGSGESGPNKNGTWDNYEEAMETCLQEALKFI